jgi:hypothetical protein
LNGLRLLWSKVYSIPASCYPPVCQPVLSGLDADPQVKSNREPDSLSLKGECSNPRHLGHKTRRIALSAPRKARITLSQGPREAEKNFRILSGLERAYGSDRAKSVLEQAITIFHASNPHAENNPELYELFENGQVDQALEMFGASPWVIGRVKA